jgi:hypothetical protein
MEMNKNTINHLAAFITEDPNEFSPDLQVSGGPLDIMEQEERQRLLPGMEGGREVLSTMQVGPNRDITYEVIVVDDVEEIMRLGEGTKWCFNPDPPHDPNDTGSEDARRTAEMYKPIYFVLKDGEPFIAASERAGLGWHNRDDVPLSKPSPALEVVLQDAGVPEGIYEGGGGANDWGATELQAREDAQHDHDQHWQDQAMGGGDDSLSEPWQNQAGGGGAAGPDAGEHYGREAWREGLVRAGVINEFQGGSDIPEEYTLELLTSDAQPEGMWILFKGANMMDLDLNVNDTPLLGQLSFAIDSAKSAGAKQITVKPVPRRGQLDRPPQSTGATWQDKKFGAREDDSLSEPWHHQARGGGAAGPDAGEYYGREAWREGPHGG